MPDKIDLWFDLSAPKLWNLFFDIQYFRKLTELFPCNRIFDSHRWNRWYWSVLGKYQKSGDHWRSNNDLILLLIITFPSYLYNFLMFSRHICLYKALSLNVWSTPMATIRCFSRYDYNNHLRITRFCSNDSISIFESTTFSNARDFLQCYDRTVYLSVWEQK